MSGNAQGTGYVDSLEAAAGVTDYSVAFLRELKRRGCPAFRGSRVYLDELAAYIEENDLEELREQVAALDELNAELLRERLRKLRFANDVEEGLYVRKETITEQVLELAVSLKSLLRRKLEDEGPDRLTMRTREEAAEVLRSIVDEICTTLSSSPLLR